MNISQEQFEQWVAEAIDSLPEKYLNNIYNVAFIVEDYPTSAQHKKSKLDKGHVLYGLYEGYHQSGRRTNGLIMPDRITIFRRAIVNQCSTEQEVKDQIFSTVMHEIAHHFGSDEKGARNASKNKAG